MASLQEELYLLLDEEDRIYKESRKEGIEYKRKNFEILEGEVREVLEDEGILVRENPLDFPPSVQRKYFGQSASEWEFPPSVDPSVEGFEVPNGQYLHISNIRNPYTGEEKAIYSLYDNPKNTKEMTLQNVKNGSNDLEGYEFSDIEIGDIITARVFDGNTYAQMVLQAKATEAMFRKIAGVGTPEDDAVLEKKNQVMTAVNEIRALFSLSPM